MNFFKNYLSTLFMLGCGYVFYTNNTHFINFSSGTVGLSFVDFHISLLYFFYAILALYTLFLIPFYLYYETPSKARVVLGYLWRLIRGRFSYSQKEQTALLAWIVKLFFAPLMIVWLTQHIFNLINNFYAASQNISLFSVDFLLFFNNHLFFLVFSTILFFDVLFFTFGYLFEAPFLKNTIRSVEPTIIGWAVAILCYPPFNNNVSNLISWYSTDFPTFSNMYVHLTLNIIILILMGIYAWASVSLGFKASNLTNRGIVSKGPYKYVRHPAYICKNIAWLIGGVPMIILSFSDPGLSFFAVLLGLGGWAFLYYMRAMTEEAHLSLDPDYIQYKKKVHYKFIPKIW